LKRVRSEGHSDVADLAAFATGGVTLLIAKVDAI
jgi:hypothetical protein